MICPTCHNVMIVVEHKQIELDYCSDCSGTWFDSGELELMSDVTGAAGNGLSLSDILTLPETKTTEKKRKCPICHQKMKKTAIGDETEVLIDVCLLGDGLWFDGGEVHEVITQYLAKPSAESDSGERILTFLGDTFRAGNQPAGDS